MQEQESYKPSPLVLDVGTFQTKAGWGGDEAPRSCFPTVLGIQRHHHSWVQKPNYVGDDALAKIGIYTIKRGEELNWDQREIVYNYIFSEQLRVDPIEQPVLMTGYPTELLEDRKKQIQIMFESFKCPASHVADPAALSLFAYGETTGLVAEMGEQGFRVTPVLEGNALAQYSRKSRVKGKTILLYLVKLFLDKDYLFTAPHEFDYVRTIKDTMCSVALEYHDDADLPEIDYELPDGTMISLGHQQTLKTAELLFNPSLMDGDQHDHPGIHQLIFDVIASCPLDIRQTMVDKIHLSGGTSKFRGLEERLSLELQKLIPQLNLSNFYQVIDVPEKGVDLFYKMPLEMKQLTKYYFENPKVEIHSVPERRYATWIGGSILSTLPMFQSAWISKEAYEEEGENIVERLCWKTPDIEPKHRVLPKQVC